MAVAVSRQRGHSVAKTDAEPLQHPGAPAGTALDAGAVRAMEAGLAADSGFVLAKAFLAFTLMNLAGLGWGDAESWTLGARLAAEALTEDRGDSEVLRNAGQALAFFTHDHDGARAAMERALALNPNSVRTQWSAGWVCCYRAEAAPAIALFERSLRLSPLDAELGYMLSGFGLAHLIAGNPAQALPLLRRCIHEMRAWTSGPQFLVVALGWLGRTVEAREEAARLRVLVPRGCGLGRKAGRSVLAVSATISWPRCWTLAFRPRSLSTQRLALSLRDFADGVPIIQAVGEDRQPRAGEVGGRCGAGRRLAKGHTSDADEGRLWDESGCSGVAQQPAVTLGRPTMLNLPTTRDARSVSALRAENAVVLVAIKDVSCRCKVPYGGSLVSNEIVPLRRGYDRDFGACRRFLDEHAR